MMITIPAIAIRNGVCVIPGTAASVDAALLVRDPVGLARAWASAGFRRLQVADVDGSSDRRASAAAIEEIVRDGAIGVQAVVGDQSSDFIDRMMDAGAEQVVINASIVDDSDWIDSTAQAYPHCVVVATDVGDRRVVTRGWMRTLPIEVFDLISDLQGLPLAGLLVSVIDGNASATIGELALLEDIAEASNVPVLASGGAATMNDLRALEHRGISGVVLGSAFYAGVLDARSVAQEFNV